MRLYTNFVYINDCVWVWHWIYARLPVYSFIHSCRRIVSQRIRMLHICLCVKMLKLIKMYRSPIDSIQFRNIIMCVYTCLLYTTHERYKLKGISVTISMPVMPVHCVVTSSLYISWHHIIRNRWIHDSHSVGRLLSAFSLKKKTVWLTVVHAWLLRIHCRFRLNWMNRFYEWIDFVLFNVFKLTTASSERVPYMWFY